MINGVAVNTDELMDKAVRVVNKTNIHQFATVLELYYLDHNEYPRVRGGAALVSTLSEGGYIQNKPLDPTVFEYEPAADGESYRLTLKDI